MKKAVIFDVDGVIIDSEPVYRQRRAQFFKEHGIELTEAQQQAFVGSNPNDMFLALYPTEPELRSEMQVAYGAYRDEFKVDYRALLNPDISTVLQELKAKGYQLAVASSGDYATICQLLKDNQLFDYFQEIVSGQQFKQSKPNPEIYLHTVGLLGLELADCVAVEDSFHGITAALAANLDVLALEDLRYGVDQSQATKIIQSLKELPLWLTE